MAYLNHLKQLVAAKVEFRLEGEVPSEELINARRLALQTRGVEAYVVRTVENSVYIGFLAVALSVIAGLLSFLMTQNCNLLGYGLVGVLTLCAIAAAVNPYVSRLDVLKEELEGLVPLHQEDCEEMLVACYATPEGAAYRERVVAANRQFVMAEKNLLEDWASTAHVRAKCAQLYAIPGAA